jgi:hypothetical protein
VQVGRHDKALRILALDIGDVPAAVQYSQKHLGISDGHTQLQHLLLHPDDGSPPRLLDACRLLRTAGAMLREQTAPAVPLTQFERNIKPFATSSQVSLAAVRCSSP